MGKKEEDKARHEYLLMEFRLGEQRVIDEIAEKFEPRIRVLEDAKLLIYAIVSTLGAIVGYDKIVDWAKGGK